MTDSNDKLEIDTLQLYFGEPFIIHDDIFNDIQILQPTIGDIIKEGEKKVYSAVNIFVTNTTSYRVQLWDLGIDWNKLSDLRLFCMLAPNLSKDST